MRSDPYRKAAAPAGYSDVNDFLEAGADRMAQRAMAQLFSYDLVVPRTGRLPEVGARSGRFTREIVKYVPGEVEIVGWSNVTVVEGDAFATSFPDASFERLLIPWFDMTMSLYRWGLLLRESARLLKPGGVVAFDFMDSQDHLIEVLAKESNAPYFMVNGSDLELIAKHLGLVKLLEFDEHFNQQIAKYHVYRKLAPEA